VTGSDEELALEREAQALLPGLRRAGPLRRSLKSRLLPCELDGEPLLVKQLARDDALWRWYFARELELYRSFAAEPPPCRLPRLRAADAERRLLVLERFAESPLATTRLASGALDARVLEALALTCDALAGWTRGLELAPREPPAPAAVRELRRRLLEDPSAPLGWVREGIARCAALGILAGADAAAALDALAAHPAVTFAHGDLLPRNAFALPGGAVALVDWECAGAHPAGWDRALLWVNAPAARARLEADLDAGEAAGTFWACVLFALGREIKFRRRGGRDDDARVAALRAELARARTRLCR
jgi:hypothetical protein